jgi:hypothetical protein
MPSAAIDLASSREPVEYRSRRAFRDRPIQKTRQRGRFVGVEGNESDITRPRNLDSRKGRQKSPGRHIRLHDGQGADSYAETIDYGLQCDKEMVENAPTLFWPMRQPRVFQPVGPIPGRVSLLRSTWLTISPG